MHFAMCGHADTSAPRKSGTSTEWCRSVSRQFNTSFFAGAELSGHLPKYLKTLRHYPTCAASETCHTRTAGARLASPAELHHVAAAAAGTNSVACGIQMVMPAFNIVVSADRLAKYRPRLIPSIPISASVAYCQVEQ